MSTVIKIKDKRSTDSKCYVLQKKKKSCESPRLDMPKKVLRSLTQRTAEQSQRQHAKETGSSQRWSANEKGWSGERSVSATRSCTGRGALTESRHHITNHLLRVENIDAHEPNKVLGYTSITSFDIYKNEIQQIKWNVLCNANYLFCYLHFGKSQGNKSHALHF